MLINGVSSVGLSMGANRTVQSRANLPPTMLSRSEPKMSDEEFEQRIIEMAKRDHAAGRFQSQDPSSEFHTLERSFVSVVSPDREGIINNALPRAMATITNRARIWTELSFEELVWKLLFGESPPLASSNQGNQGHQMLLYEFKDASGNVIAELFTGGWSMRSTPAENARSLDFITIYNQAWRTADHEARYGWLRELPQECGWAEGMSESEMLAVLAAAVPSWFAENMPTVDASELQPQQGQAAKQTAARYEANLHEVS
ncbi:MAG: hypothetical protein FWF80_01705 [Defluviitaleaceae bacterium]|nr:hypothetical protein [Defluviitaleaceae bacterium]